VVDAQTQTKHYLSGLLAYYQPINESLVAGIGVYIPSALRQPLGRNDFHRSVQPHGLPNGRARIGLVTISPGVSYKINDMISVGATFNINYGMFSLKRWAGNTEIPSRPMSSTSGSTI